jgi:ABC-type phosphate transport system substrate-binding protein
MENPMKKSTKDLPIHFCEALLLIFASRLSAADIKVIANPSVGASAVSADELKGVFLGTKTSLSDGSHVEPVLLKSGAVHEAFLKEYVGKTDDALNTYYRSLVFTGKGSMPKAFASDAEVVGFVEKTKGAIGYVGSGASAGSAKTLEVK